MVSLNTHLLKCSGREKERFISFYMIQRKIGSVTISQLIPAAGGKKAGSESQKMFGLDKTLWNTIEHRLPTCLICRSLKNFEAKIQLSNCIHLSQLTPTCYQLRPLLVVFRSLSCHATATLIHTGKLLLYPGGLAPSSNRPTWLGSSLCCSSYWAHPEICLCHSTYARHAALASSCTR